MPIFRVQVFKQISGSDREWSNTYLIRAADLDAAIPAATTLGTSETFYHLDNVTITRARVSDTVEGTDVFASVPLNLTGLRGGGADAAWLPLFNTFRLDFNAEGGGRPSRKFYRGPVLETDQQAGFVDPTVLGLFVTNANTLIGLLDTAGTPLVDPDDQLLTSAVGYAKVQMRQPHRKRKKAVVSP